MHSSAKELCYVKSAEIREDFLSFFESKGCRRMDSSSLIPDDPSLLLTSAGMVQFKQYYLGKRTMDAKGATTCQKCVRTSDIDEIGLDGRHLSFFEMLGNFSFGGYGKREACEYAFEFITEHLKLPLEKLYFSIYLDDDEAHDIWRDLGVAEDRIVRLGEDDNFWAAGPTGPCGPCSEIYYDQGPDKIHCDNPDCAPGCDCDRFLEFWNLVFTQFDRQEDGELKPLAHVNIDTGMGLERISAIMQGVVSNYDTDILRDLVGLAEKLSAKTYGADDKTDISLRIIADHARAVTFMIADGILPSNEGRGYVLRRLLRRAIRHGRLIDIEGKFMDKFVDEVNKEMGHQYPEIESNLALIKGIVNAEEEHFGATLSNGVSYLEKELSELKDGEKLSGEKAFTLHDTYGFPIDLTVEMAHENGVEVDLAGFEKAMNEQKERARSQVKDEVWTNFNNVWTELSENLAPSEFVGYTENEADSKVLALVKDGASIEEAHAGDELEIVLDKTPFYGEMGGQVGDSGTITLEDGSSFEVKDTQHKEGIFISHIGTLTQGSIKRGDRVHAAIDVARREFIRRNHTATHILHWALREVLGEHVTQAGSIVYPDRLRFDFTHFEALSQEQIKEIEDLCNIQIMSDWPVKNYETDIETAKSNGVLALFGEKYGERVRVLEVGDFSKELCGGTHIKHNSSEIGLLKITSEGSVGSNVRRVEAVTSVAALKYLNEQDAIVKQMAANLKSQPKDLLSRVEQLSTKIKELEHELKQAKKVGSNARQEISALVEKADKSLEYPVIVEALEGYDSSSLRELWDRLHQAMGEGAVVLASKNGESPLLLAAASEGAVAKGFNAGAIIKQIAPLISGGGGGKPQMAQAGGKDASGIADALTKAKEILGLIKD